MLIGDAGNRRRYPLENTLTNTLVDTHRKKNTPDLPIALIKSVETFGRLYNLADSTSYGLSVFACLGSVAGFLLKSVEFCFDLLR